jgi:hypothetical protein
LDHPIATTTGCECRAEGSWSLTAKCGTDFLRKLVEAVVYADPTPPFARAPWRACPGWNDAGDHLTSAWDLDFVGLPGFNGSHES